MDLKTRNDAAVGDGQPLPTPLDGEGRAMPLPTPRAGDGRAAPLPATRADDLPAEEKRPSRTSHETYSVTKPVLDYYYDRARGHFARFNNMSIAFKLAGRDLRKRIVKTGRVFDLKPSNAIERYLETRALKEEADVAARRRDWDQAKRRGDPGEMTATANALLRAVEEARAHLGAHEAAHTANTDGGRHPTSEVLNPSGSKDGGDIDPRAIEAKLAVDGGVSVADDASAPKPNSEASTGESASGSAGVGDHATMESPEQARIAADIIAGDPGETRPASDHDVLDRYARLDLGEVLKIVDADVQREGGLSRSTRAGPGVEQDDEGAFGSRRPDEPRDRQDGVLELSAPGERKSAVKHDVPTANVAKELQYFSYDPKDFEKNFPGWSGPLVVFDDVFPDGLPRPLGQRYFRQNKRGFGGYLVRKNGPHGRPRDYAFLIKGVEVSDPARRGADIGALGPGSVAQINEVAEDVYQQMKAQGVFQDIKAGGSLMLTGHSQGAPQAQLLALYIMVRAIQDPDNKLSEAEALRGIYVRAFGGAGARNAVQFLRDPEGNRLVVPPSVLDNIDAITYLLTGDPAGSSAEPYVGEAWVVDSPDPSRFTPDEAWARGPLRDHPRSAYRAADYRTARPDTRKRFGNAGDPRYQRLNE